MSTDQPTHDSAAKRGSMQRLNSWLQRIHPLSGSDAVIGQGLVLIGLFGIFRWWALTGSWFMMDDFAFMSRASNMPFGWAYLSETYGGHFMPAGFLITWALNHWFPYRWSAWSSVLLVMQIVAAIGMLKLLVSAFGIRRAILPLLIGYLTLVFTFPAGIWYAAGINQLPMQIALTFGLAAHLTHLRTKSRSSLITSLALVAVALCFYEKSLMLVPIFWLVALGWFSRGELTHRIQYLWENYRPAMVAYGALSAGFLAIYAHFVTGVEKPAGDLVATPMLQTLAGRAFPTAAVGGPLNWEALGGGPIANPSDLVVLGAWACIGLLVYGAHRTRIRTRRAWILIAFGLVANVVILSATRANIVGPAVGLEYRYQTENSLLWLMSIGLAYLPLLGAVQTVELREGADLSYESPSIIQGVTAVVAAAGLFSTTTYMTGWEKSNAAPAFFGNLINSSKAAPNKPVPMADLGLPQTIMWSYRFPENIYSHVFRQLKLPLTYPDSTIDSLYALDSTGTVSPVLLEPARQIVPTEGCGYKLGSSSTRIPFDGPISGDGWWVRLEYIAQRDSDMNLYIGQEHYTFNLPAGMHGVFFKAQGKFDAMSVSVSSSDDGVCVTGGTLGIPKAVESP